MRKSVQKQEKRQKVTRNGKKIISVFSHFQTLFVVSPVSRHFFFYFQTQKCLEMGEKQNKQKRHIQLLLYINHHRRHHHQLLAIPTARTQASANVESSRRWQASLWTRSCYKKRKSHYCSWKDKVEIGNQYNHWYHHYITF